MVPTAARDFNSLRQAHFVQAAARKEKGTNEKDLFYHLVRLSFRRWGLELTVLPS